MANEPIVYDPRKGKYVPAPKVTKVDLSQYNELYNLVDQHNTAVKAGTATTRLQQLEALEEKKQQRNIEAGTKILRDAGWNETEIAQAQATLTDSRYTFQNDPLGGAGASGSGGSGIAYLDDNTNVNPKPGYVRQDGDLTKIEQDNTSIEDLLKQYANIFSAQTSTPQTNYHELLSHKNKISEVEKIYFAFNFDFGFHISDYEIQDQIFLLEILRDHLRIIQQKKGSIENGILWQKQKLRKKTKKKGQRKPSYF